LTKELEQAIKEEDPPFKVADSGIIHVEREQRNKVTSLTLWVEAWDRYSEAVTILYETRENELALHQRKVIKLCSSLPFETVYTWDKAKRFFLSEERSKTLLTTDYELDARYLIYGKNPKQTEYGRAVESFKAGTRSNDTCRRFNWSWKCIFGEKCNFKHECATCGGAHPAKTCKGKEVNQKRKRSEDSQLEPGKQK